MIDARLAEINDLGVMNFAPDELPAWAGRVVLETGLSPDDARVLTYGIEEELQTTDDVANVSVGDLDTNGSLSSFNQRLGSVSLTDYMEGELHVTCDLDEFRGWLSGWVTGLDENGIEFHSLDEALEIYSDYLETGHRILKVHEANDNK